MSEARLPCEVLFGHASDVVGESAVRFIQLLHYVGERKSPFLFRHLCVESIDTAVLEVSRWSASCDDERQILQRLLQSLKKLLFIHGLGFASPPIASHTAASPAVHLLMSADCSLILAQLLR